MIRFKQWYDVKAMTPEERRLFYVWKGMRDRCSRRKNPAWNRYGGRGIKVCDRWQNSFAAFIEDMGFPPPGDYDLDRYPNNDGNYEKSNCRWATTLENLRNVSTNVWIEIEINGVMIKKTMCEWADEYGIDRATMFYRVKIGWTGMDLLIGPRVKAKSRTINGVTRRYTEWAKIAGLTLVGFTARCDRNEPDDIILRPSAKKRKNGELIVDTSQPACATVALK